LKVARERTIDLSFVGLVQQLLAGLERLYTMHSCWRKRDRYPHWNPTCAVVANLNGLMLPTLASLYLLGTGTIVKFNDLIVASETRKLTPVRKFR
jgi:hypothetical protein